ncbi:MAG: N-acetyl-alpha-D-glucosaminyl L-malate synthase BshA [Planctomycetes bacterium]|nr:N-acetyl-alpha-D-glucosaminyl L-malate synthase BshA [Planctomycetota bacterium]
MNAGSTDFPLKIGIACYPTHGGSGVLATELGVALAERGHEVHFLAYSKPPRLSRYHPRIFCHLVEVSEYPLFKYPPYDLALASKMIEVIGERRLDLLHVHYAIPHSISAYLARQLMPGVRFGIVTTLHGTDITLVGSGNAYRDVTRFGIEQSDEVIAVSEWLKKETQRIFGATKEIQVVPNFVDVTRFRPKEGRTSPLLCACADSPIVMHVSNFRPVKRLGDTVRAFADATAGTKAQLVLVGDGPERAGAEALVAELKLEERVQFLGIVDDVHDLLPFADVLVVSSESESFGLAALEAHACGVPVVGYDSGGMREVVEDNSTGFLVRFGDVPALAARLKTLLADATLRRDFGARGRKRAVEQFDLAQVLTVHERIYHAALARRGRGAVG